MKNGFLLNLSMRYVGILGATINRFNCKNVKRTYIAMGHETNKDTLCTQIMACSAQNILPVRVTPKAASNRIVVQDGAVRAYVTTVPENGKATKDVVKLLSKALHIPKSRITLLRGATSRDKQFHIQD
jgi:uncharacterized protein YggU (UPF0235/DUF167 family)